MYICSSIQYTHEYQILINIWAAKYYLTLYFEINMKKKLTFNCIYSFIIKHDFILLGCTFSHSMCFARGLHKMYNA